MHAFDPGLLSHPGLGYWATVCRTSTETVTIRR